MKDLLYDLQSFMLNCDPMDNENVNTLYRYASNDSRHPLHAFCKFCDGMAESRGLDPFVYFLSVWRQTEEEISAYEE